MHTEPKIYLLIAILLCSSLWVNAQISLLGVTKDSVTHEALSFVSISVSGKVTAVSDENGFFKLISKAGDTLSFSRVGFKTKRLVSLTDGNNLIVSMAESTTVLNSITIYGNHKPQGQAQWRKYIILPKPFQNPTMKDSTGMIQTFGAGVKFPGVFSYFTDEQIEKRKMKRVTNDLTATKIYREVMSSEKVKAYLMESFSLTEELYFKKIKAFNLQHPDAAYAGDRDEIINLLTWFFALKGK